MIDLQQILFKIWRAISENE